MDISEDGTVSGSVNRAELAEAYANATDDNVKANLASAAAEHGMYVEGDQLVDPSAAPPEAPAEAEEPSTTEAPASEPAAESSGQPTQADNKATWVDYAVSKGADRDEAEASTKADLVERYGG
jgi:hypothetical protein